MLRTRHGLRPLSLRERHAPAARNRSAAPRGVPQGGTHALRAPRSEAAYGCAASTSRCAIRSTRVHSPERYMHCVKWAGASSHGTPTHRPRHDQAQRETTLRPSRIAAPIVALSMSPCSAQRRVTATSTHRTPPPHPATTISPCRRAAPHIALIIENKPRTHHEHDAPPRAAQREAPSRHRGRVTSSTVQPAQWLRPEHRRAPQWLRIENASRTDRAPRGAKPRRERTDRPAREHRGGRAPARTTTGRVGQGGRVSDLLLSLSASS